MTLKHSRVDRGKLLAAISITFFIICLLADPARYIGSVSDGLLVFATSVMPALFPFFFFTKLLTSIGTAETLGDILRKPMHSIYRAPSCGGYIYFMSVLSGYPVGARLISDLYSEGVLSEKQAKSVSTFTSTSGPLFLLGTISTVIFKDKSVGYLLMAAHFAAALVNGLIYRPRKAEAELELPRVKRDYDNILSDTISNSIISVLIVGGYIAIFYLVCDVFIDVGLIDLLSKGLGALLALFGGDPAIARGLCLSMIEITRGCLELSVSGVNIEELLPFIAFIVSFGGLSITFQSVTYLAKCKVKTSFYLLSKLTHAIISFIMCYALTAIFL